jgi:hypothetical protein
VCDRRGSNCRSSGGREGGGTTATSAGRRWQLLLHPFFVLLFPVAELVQLLPSRRPGGSRVASGFLCRTLLSASIITAAAAVFH